jgi:hypothetical protein
MRSPEKPLSDPESAGESGVSLPAHSKWRAEGGYIYDASDNAIFAALRPDDPLREARLTLAATAPELRDALEALKSKHRVASRNCWCPVGSDVYHGKHAYACEMARAALAKVRRAQAGPVEPSKTQDEKENRLLTLDALHEVEERLTNEQWWAYEAALTEGPFGTGDHFRQIVHATTAQKIKALAAVLAKAGCV